MGRDVMLLEQMIRCKHYKFAKEAKDWREAICISCQPLEADGSVTAGYKEEIIQAVEQYGPYIVIMPNVAIPHAQEHSHHVKKTAVSFLKLEKPVCFADGQEKKYVQHFFTFASCNGNEHVENVKNLVNLLLDDAFVKALEQVACEQDFIQLQQDWEGEF